MSDVLVWFDGACPLCRREIAVMRRLDRRDAIAFVDVSRAATPDGAGCPVDRSALLARFHALEDGRVVSGAAAFAAMWRAIPLLRPLGLAARNRLRAGGTGAAVRPVPPRAASAATGGSAAGNAASGVTA
jgi:predicted DCC family thiol-disulfide oxidoreductase YuxK